MDYPTPEREAERQRAVAAYNVMGTGPEAAFDDLTELAAQIAGTPISLINIVADATFWVKARVGVPPDITEVPRGAVCCAHTVCRSDLLVVPDLTQDQRFSNLPFVATEPFVKFYAGMPLINPEGYALGTLCIMDFEPRELSFEAMEAIRRLSRQVVAQLELRRRLAEIEEARRQLLEEKQRAESLILNILPADIASELERAGRVEPRYYPSATILFADFVGFTQFAEALAPRALIDDLDQYFSSFDEIIASCGLEKLKTIGDAYMAAGGLPQESKHHAVDACLAALQMQHFMRRANAQRGKMRLEPWQLRLGVHTGSVMAGVVGKQKFTYDVWGDSVNIAARLEATSEPGCVNVSESTYQHIKAFFETTPRGSIQVKNKGPLAMHFLERLKAEFARDPDGLLPNDAFRTARSGSATTWALPS